MKRNLSFSHIIVIAVLAVWLCALPAFGKDQRPIRIGWIVPYTGVMAYGGNALDKGFRLAMEEAGYQVAGRKIEVFKEDTEAKPEVGLTKARKLIEQNKVDVLAGVDNSAVAVAIRDLVISSKVPLVITNAGAAQLTGKLKSPYIFRTSFANGQQDLVGGWYAYTKLGYRRMVLVSADFIAGHEKAEAFAKTFTAAGGKIVDQIFPPLGTTDFSPYLTKLGSEAKSIDAVWVFVTDQGAIRFIQQYQEYGLNKTLPLFPIGDTVDDTLLPSMKDAAAGIKNYMHYVPTLTTPANQKFVKAYMARFKEAPGVYDEEGYVGAKAILLALAAIHGDVENTNAFLAALRQVKFDAPRGPISFDANQNAINPVYIRQVEKVDGHYSNVMLDTIPNVDEDWTPAGLTASKK